MRILAQSHCGDATSDAPACPAPDLMAIGHRTSHWARLRVLTALTSGSGSPPTPPPGWVHHEHDRTKKAAQHDSSEQPDGHNVAGKIPAPHTTVLSLRINAPHGQYLYRSRQRCRTAGVFPALQTGSSEMTLSTRCRTADASRRRDVPAVGLAEDGEHLAPKTPVAQVDLVGAYTVREAAEILQLTAGTVYELIRERSIPHVRVGHQFRIGKLAFWAYLNGLDGEQLAQELVSSSGRDRHRWEPAAPDTSGKRRG